jgi:hypothetical protein
MANRRKFSDEYKRAAVRLIRRPNSEAAWPDPGRTWLACIGTVAFLFMACDSSLFSPAPSAVCEVSGSQCQLPEGPLGACERAPCPTGETPPCFQCTPQH